MHEDFLRAIHNKNIIVIRFNSNEKGIISRKCIPFDFGPSRRYKDKQDRYHLYDLDSPSKSHNLSLLPSQLLNLIVTEETFDPGDYATWQPNWIVARDWGRFS